MIVFCVSCEKKHEKQALEKPELTKDKESTSPVESTASSAASKETLHPAIVAPATINRIFREANSAFDNKEYSTAVAKLEELLKLLGPVRNAPCEKLNFQIGLSQLLGEKYPEAVLAFKDCIQRFPKGEYTSHAYLGLERALIFQKQSDLKTEALTAFKMAAHLTRKNVNSGGPPFLIDSKN